MLDTLTLTEARAARREGGQRENQLDSLPTERRDTYKYTRLVRKACRGEQLVV